MIEARTFWELVERRALETPEALFGLDESLKSMTFGEYRDAAERVAAGLFAQGIGAGSLVSWILPTCFDSLVLTAALARLGAVQIPILPIYRGREVGFCLKQTGAQLVIIPRVYRDFDYTEMLAKLGVKDVIQFDEAGVHSRLHRAFAQQSSAERVNRSDEAAFNVVECYNQPFTLFAG